MKPPRLRGYNNTQPETHNNSGPVPGFFNGFSVCYIHLMSEKKVPEREEDTLRFWKENSIFEKSVSKDSPRGVFSFYDGPPFATGLPHPGHFLQSVIKDAIPRYETMRGKSVRRVWGWDCHGLPIENLIESELGFKHKKEIEDYGIDKFNAKAKESVLRFDKEWKEIIPRLGRFIDMDLSYKTMDTSYTESIWWAFKELYDRGLIYEGRKIMYVCPRCETPLAQSEVALNYQDITDISVTVKFELEDEPGTFLLAWTTTPWTLPGNTAIAINESLSYVKVKNKTEESAVKEFFVVAKERVNFVFKEGTFEIVEEFNGKKLIGKSYKPVFDYYKDADLENKKNIWKIWHADFVTTEMGTGIAHEAPAYGAEDMELAKENKIPVIEHVKMDGVFRKEVTDFAGTYVKKKGDSQSADIEVIKNLAHKGLLFAKEKIVHSYPLCWRCDTPLLNFATSSWFVKVTEIKDKLISENQEIHWVPEHIRDGRFGKWLEGARDWAISRSRYWGAPIPVWKCAECDKSHVIGSLRELSKGITAKNIYYAMRHGEAKSNTDGYIDFGGDPENHLSDKGKKEAENEALKLKGKGITYIYTSPLVRCVESARLVAAALGIPKKNIIEDKRLSEFCADPSLQGKSIDQREKAKVPADLYRRKGEGETHAEVRTRTLSLIHELEKTLSGEKILFVTHGSPLWMLLSGARLYTDEEAFKFKEEKTADINEYFLKNGHVEEVNYMPSANDGAEINLHRPHIDNVDFVCSCGGVMKRVPEVFDCWFESGAMPFAQFHYPFENEKEFLSHYPADFIAEALDQTRGWFYSLLVLNVALFGTKPYKNVICTGLLTAEGGQKLSKRLKNYADPVELLQTYGADAMRFALLSSSVIRGEDVEFGEKAVDEVYKKLIIRMENVFSFYELFKTEESPGESSNILDRWIIARMAKLAGEVTEGFDRYELDLATRPILEFTDDLSVWYVRRSRGRFKGDDRNDAGHASKTLRLVLTGLSKLMAPSTPFIAERMYRALSGSDDSVHLTTWPEELLRNLSAEEREMISRMEGVRNIVSRGLEERAKAAIKVRQPLKTLEVKGEKLEDEYVELIKDEVNIKEVVFAQALSGEVVLDINITDELREEGDLRDLVREVQELRKKAALTPRDKANLHFSADEKGNGFIEKHKDYILKQCILSGISSGGAVGGSEVTLSMGVITVFIANA